jgi:two-component system CheB/CheR fusion protein
MTTTPLPLGLRVLVVDDNRDAAGTTALLLKLWGHQPLVAYDGPSALATALDQRPDVILLDIGLPGMTGREVARRLREQPGMNKVLLVALTGYGQASDYQLSQEAGFDLHMVKPYDPETLRLAIAKGRPDR